jgi:actin-like ATPase involved in cell morphogenesis
MTIGIDVGTYNLVSCRKDKDQFSFDKFVNAFIKIPMDNPFTFNMMKESKVKVPLIEREDYAYALGEAAVNMAYALGNIELHRPMISGCVNPKEKEAFQIMCVMIHSLINAKSDNESLCYCVPANAVNEDTDAEYHQKVIESIFKAYKSPEGFKVNAFPINEALALAYSELGEKGYTGIAVSCGSGMTNVCYAMYGNPVIKFSIVNSGDWIDRQAAKATGESVAFINLEKTKIDLSKPALTLTERAIKTQYEIMIDKTIQGLVKGFSEIKGGQIGKETDCVVAGGVSSPPGFVQLFEEALSKSKLPLKVNRVFRPDEPLLSVAKGCLIAAENAKKL